jgi:hypothetical protein
MSAPKVIHPAFGCSWCLAVLDWNLIGACASVGIEHGKPTGQMAAQFMAAYHAEHAEAYAEHVAAAENAEP